MDTTHHPRGRKSWPCAVAPKERVEHNNQNTDDAPPTRNEEQQNHTAGDIPHSHQDSTCSTPAPDVPNRTTPTSPQRTRTQQITGPPSQTTLTTMSQSQLHTTKTAKNVINVAGTENTPPSREGKGKNTHGKGQKGNRGKGNQALPQSHVTRTKDPVANLKAKLQEPVNLSDLATAYGLQYDKIQKVWKTRKPWERIGVRMEKPNATCGVLQGIKRYLEYQKNHASGGEHIPLRLTTPSMFPSDDRRKTKRCSL